MVDDPLNNSLTLNGPQLGPVMAPKGPHLAINRPTLGPTLALDQPVGLCFMGNGSNTLECMLDDLLDNSLTLTV